MIGPAIFDILRMVIVVSAGAVAILWYLYGRKTRKWIWAITALCWLIPVIVFFVLRFIVALPVVTLNLASLSLYLIGIGILGGIATAKLRLESRLGE